MATVTLLSDEEAAPDVRAVFAMASQTNALAAGLAVPGDEVFQA